MSTTLSPALQVGIGLINSFANMQFAKWAAISAGLVSGYRSTSKVIVDHGQEQTNKKEH